MDIQIDNEAKDFIIKKIKDKSISVEAMERPGRS